MRDPLLGPLVGGQKARDELVAEVPAELLHELDGVLALLVEGEAHAEAELGVVLEEGVRPGRSAAVGVDGVGSRREVRTVDRGAAGGVGHEEPVAVELRHQLDVGRLAAAETGARELEERLHELGVLDVDLQLRPVDFRKVEEELEVLTLGRTQRRLGDHVEGLVPRVSLVLGGADDRAEVAARAVFRGDLDRVLPPLELGGPIVHRLERRRGLLEQCRIVDLGTDCRVRADHRALVALDAETLVPRRDLDGDVPLLPARRPRGEGAVDRERGDGKEVALVGEHERRDPLDEVGRLERDDRRHLQIRGGRRRHLHLVEVRERLVDGLEVHPYELGALLAVGLLDRLLDLGDRFLTREDTRDREEAGLHDRVDAPAHAGAVADLVAVDHVEADLLRDDLALDLDREMVPDLVGAVRGVQEENGAGSREIEDVVLLEEPELVAGDEARGPDEVGGADRLRTEAQVRDRDPARLLRVVDEVALGEVVGLLADDLDRVLVRADGAVRAEAEEDGSRHGGRLGVEGGVPRQGEMRHVVDDADGEAALRLLLAQLVEDSLDHRGRELLGGEPVAPADDLRFDRKRRGPVFPRVAKDRHDVQEERLADGAGLLGPVEDGDCLHRLREGSEEGGGVEGAVEADLQDADLLAAGEEVLHRLVDHVGAGAHENDHALGLGVAHVVEEVVGAARQLLEGFHRLLHLAGAGVVIGVARLAGLEEAVGVLRGAAQDREVGREGAFPLGRDEVLAHHGEEVVVSEELDLGDLARGPEAVEEVKERDLRKERGAMRDGGQVVRFLRVARGEHGESGLPAGHDVGVVAEDRERVRGDGSCRDVHDERRQLACDLVHVRDHQEEPLRRRERGRQRSRLEGAVDRARRAPLGLHRRHERNGAPDVVPALGGPLVGELAHRG